MTNYPLLCIPTTHHAHQTWHWIYIHLLLRSSRTTTENWYLDCICFLILPCQETPHRRNSSCLVPQELQYIQTQLQSALGHSQPSHSANTMRLTFFSRMRFLLLLQPFSILNFNYNITDFWSTSGKPNLIFRIISYSVVGAEDHLNKCQRLWSPLLTTLTQLQLKAINHMNCINLIDIYCINTEIYRVQWAQKREGCLIFLICYTLYFTIKKNMPRSLFSWVFHLIDKSEHA